MFDSSPFLLPFDTKVQDHDVNIGLPIFDRFCQSSSAKKKRKRRPPAYFFAEQAEEKILNFHAKKARCRDQTQNRVEQSSALTVVPHFKESRSRVGYRYQVSHLPVATCTVVKTSSDLCNEPETQFISKPEAWDEMDCDRFHSYMVASRKDIRAVAKRLGKSTGCALQYYYGSYKRSIQYKQMKKMVARKRKASVSHKLQCTECLGGGELLWCEGCNNMYHLACLNISLNQLPVEKWFCDECTLYGTSEIASKSKKPKSLESYPLKVSKILSNMQNDRLNFQRYSNGTTDTSEEEFSDDYGGSMSELEDTCNNSVPDSNNEKQYVHVLSQKIGCLVENEEWIRTENTRGKVVETKQNLISSKAVLTCVEDMEILDPSALPWNKIEDMEILYPSALPWNKVEHL